MVADRVDYTEVFLMLGGLLLLAAAVLTRFDAVSHRARLRALDER